MITKAESEVKLNDLSKLAQLCPPLQHLTSK